MSEFEYRLAIGISTHLLDDGIPLIQAHADINKETYDEYGETVSKKEVGSILAICFTSYISHENVTYWTDLVSQDLYEFAEWLKLKIPEPEEFDYMMTSKPIFVEKVEFFRDPDRKPIDAARLLAQFLDNMNAYFSPVFCLPAPLDQEGLTQSELERKKQVLRRYWWKAGLEQYDEKSGHLYEMEWVNPFR